MKIGGSETMLKYENLIGTLSQIKIGGSETMFKYENLIGTLS